MPKRQGRVCVVWAAAAVVMAATPGYGQTTAGPIGAPPEEMGQMPVSVTAPSTDTGSPFAGSVASGKPTGTVIPLSITEALELGLKNNLGLLIGEYGTEAARGGRWQALSQLLPNVSAGVSETEQQIDLQAFGFPSFPGVPTIIGPFSVFDSRAYLSQKVFDWSSIENWRAAKQRNAAAEYSARDARELVVLVVGNAYLLSDADQARVEAAEAQVRTAQALDDKAADLLKAGLTPSIDKLRADVELKTRQQQLLAARNDFAKQKLNLARAIGLPDGQEFSLASRIPYAPYQPRPVDEILKHAYAARADYQAAEAKVRAAQLARRAAAAGRWPTLGFSANYGDIGLAPGNSHGTFATVGTLNIPIFEGNRAHGEVLQADALVREREAQLADLKSRIDYEVRTALLDLKTADEQVQVAQSSLSLARQTLQQAEDRFAAGVADNLEVVQAQDNVAAANEAYISSLYAHNVAKVLLARSVGVAEQEVMRYLGGK